MGKLTLTYLNHHSIPQDFYEMFLGSLEGCPYPVIELQGYDDDLTAGRLDEYRAVDTEYICTLDPDDIIDYTKFEPIIKFLDDNPSYAACGMVEEIINPDGSTMRLPEYKGFDYHRLALSPVELHNGTVFRMSMLTEFLPVLEEHFFVNPDWAVKMLVSSKYPVHKLNVCGYKWRRRTDSHSANKQAKGNVPNHKTVRYMVERELIRDPFNKKRLTRIS